MNSSNPKSPGAIMQDKWVFYDVHTIIHVGICYNNTKHTHDLTGDVGYESPIKKKKKQMIQFLKEQKVF